MVSEPVVQALEHVWNSLLTLNRPMALMGGIALSFWKHPRFTQDVDLLVQLAEQEVANIVDRLTGTGIKPKRQPRLDGAASPSRILRPACVSVTPRCFTTGKLQADGRDGTA